MNIVGWILSALLAIAFAGAGAMKASSGREKLLADPKMAWATDFTDPQVRAIGALEVLGALGVVLPWLFDTARVLTPIAAVGLALIMVGALITHGRRGELREAAPINLGLLVLAVAVAAIRFSQL
jgi:uncharacterized membrane protein YphA (DoxX/SURF4 family)